MRALLLAAGHGTRLRPITDSVPKCMVEVGGKPLLQHWLERLFGGGFDQILVNTHYLPHIVNRFIDHCRWREQITVVHEPELLGTAGTLKANRWFFPDGHGLLAHADNLTVFDPQDFVLMHNNRAKDVEMTMMTFECDNPRQCGIVAEDGAGRVVGFFEKVNDPPGSRANGAVYLFEPAVLDFIDDIEGDVVDFSTQVLPAFVGRMQTYLNADYHRDIGTPESLDQGRKDFEQRANQ